ncbi:PTS system mannose/fructose/N-acetylgalactosamine-transporter subunit IIB [Kibdelosporangium aridum]|uniref:PTS system, mannose-specific IIB component n=1 Tax=Kibdelosporangium aridum TaxID=2030 RepID=A0A1Y5X3P6_KIBAR|nr:PTS sugar transporter subunit IIB [Kibdelosporangium aridum]SMC68918.1 PTS system, mannose-specific IIB component [Kibdelosporangium aridum]
MPIELVRVDHRLVHGQVTMGWSRAVGADVLLVISDRVAASPFDISLMEMAVPPGVRLVVWSVDQARQAAADGAWPDGKVLALVANPIDLERLVAAGLTLSEVNIGGVRSEGARHKLTKEVHATDDELVAWKTLAGQGIRLSVQWLPAQKRKLLNDEIAKR